MKLKISLIAIIFLLWANVAIAAEMQLPAETAYKKTIEILFDMDATPSFHDNQLLLIKSAPMSIKLTDNDADCGNFLGFSYVSADNVKTSVSYKIRITKINDKTSNVQVQAIISGLMMPVNITGAEEASKHQNKEPQVLSCVSKGTLEKKLIEAIKTK